MPRPLPAEAVLHNEQTAEEQKEFSCKRLVKN
jgi:hypothetical protein